MTAQDVIDQMNIANPNVEAFVRCFKMRYKNDLSKVPGKVVGDAWTEWVKNA